MKKWISIDKSTTPDGGVIHLLEHDGEYCIRINGHELMSTRKHGSEETLATLACRSFSQKRKVRVLIGGLGFGFTLRATLATLGADAEIFVAELIPAVVAWNRNPNLKLASDALSDSRVQVIEQDVSEILRSSRSDFDVILLDIDNGPSALSVASNNKIYLESGLILIKTALRSGGCLGVWSAKDDPVFSKRMRKMGFTVEVQQTPAHKSTGQAHTLFFGFKSA